MFYLRHFKLINSMNRSNSDPVLTESPGTAWHRVPAGKDRTTTASCTYITRHLASSSLPVVIKLYISRFHYSRKH